MTTDFLWRADLGAPPNWYWSQGRPSFQFQNRFPDDGTSGHTRRINRPDT